LERWPKIAPLMAFIPLIAAGIGAAAAGVEMANQPSAPSPTNAAQSEAAAAQAQATALQKRRGMAATQLTSPLGAGAATTQKSTLG
jgi:hypothetical protein